MWIFPLISMGLFGAVFGAGLAYASRKFAVETDPRVDEVTAALPGINCGACGYPGCAGYAEAVVKGLAAPNACAPGGKETTEAVCAVLGVTVEVKEREVALIRCQGAPNAVRESEYAGVQTCALAALVNGGPLKCKYACLMMGDCMNACPFDAITWAPGHVPVIDEQKCTACKKCVSACPRALITMRGETKRVQILCRSQDKGAVARKACQVACIACTKCVKACPVDAISMDGNVAVVDSEKCILCGKCIAECPTGAIADWRPKKK